MLTQGNPAVVRLDIRDLLDVTVEDHRAAEIVSTQGPRESRANSVFGASGAAAQAGDVEQLAIEPNDERSVTTKQAPRVLRDGVEDRLHVRRRLTDHPE